MQLYLDTLQYVLENGNDRMDRTGIGTRAVFGLQNRYNLREGFPAMTTKKLAWKAVVSELLWFISGSSDERRLAEILHGKPRDEITDKKTIWTANAEAGYWKDKSKFDGDLGSIYGYQWRFWPQYIPMGKNEGDDLIITKKDSIDQLTTLVNGIKTDPFGRRHILSAWNVSDLKEMALPPCHVLAQFYVSSDNKLSCQMYQRSNDLFLGCPFNIASYSLLTHMIAQVCDLSVGEFIHVSGDTHIYLNHIDAVKEQLSRDPLPLPKLKLNTAIRNIEDFTMEDISLVDYQSHKTIKAEMAV